MSVITLPTWSVDGWTANTDTNGVVWFTGSEDGTGVDSGWFDPPGVRLAHVDRVAGHGAFRSPNQRTPRVIVLNGSGRAPDRQAAQDALDQFGAVCSDGAQHELVVVEPTRTLTALVELGASPQVNRTRSTRWRWQLTLIATDPRKYGAWTPVETPLRSEPTGGLDATTAGGLDATTAGGLDAGGVGLTGLVTATNTGTAPSYPLIQFEAGASDLVGPELANIVTGDVLRYDNTIPANSSVWINTNDHPVLNNQIYPARSVLLGGATGVDRGGSLALTGDWPSVAAKSSSTWVFRATSGGTDARARIYLRPALW